MPRAPKKAPAKEPPKPKAEPKKSSYESFAKANDTGVIVKDLGLKEGKYRIMQRTDGVWVIADESRAFYDWTVAEFSNSRDAIAGAKRRVQEELKANGEGKNNAK